jgi:tRNA U34 5-methylaminomethyl-2-thiouridine-forming methyltransferase MnmC
LSLFQNKQISILEIGFGTGLNAFIIEGKQNESINRLRRVEAYPVSAEELVSMNYVEELNALNHKGVFDKMHQSNWGEKRI